MKVFVTGSTGLLGTNLIRILAASGVPVVALIRDSSRWLLPPHPLIELRKGDLRDPDSLVRTLSGCTHVVHAAAHTRMQDTTDQWFEEINVRGTIRVAEAAVQQGVKHFVYVSTANTLGYGTIDHPGTGEEAMRAPFVRSHYARSKKRAEDALQNFRPALRICTVHPTFMLGGWDTGGSSGKIISMIIGKSIIWCPPGGKNFVHVEDVATAIHSLLLQDEKAGRYLIACENLSYREFYGLWKKISKSKAVIVPIPAAILKMMGSVGSLLRYFGVEVPLSRVNAEILCLGNYYSGGNAAVQLGIQHRPVAQSIQDAHNWWLTGRGELTK